MMNLKTGREQKKTQDDKGKDHQSSPVRLPSFETNNTIHTFVGKDAKEGTSYKFVKSAKEGFGL